MKDLLVRLASLKLEMVAAGYRLDRNEMQKISRKIARLKKRIDVKLSPKQPSCCGE